MGDCIKLDPMLIRRLTEKAVDFHCHGVGRFDFTEILALDLQEIEKILAQRKQQTILTLYLPKPHFQDFLNLMDYFQEGKKRGKFRHLIGFALEGPLLASHGGTPERGIWRPTLMEWEQLAACGSKGLIYVIFSPDAYGAGSNFRLDPKAPPIQWIAKTLMAGGVLPAPGHFMKSDPKGSAKLLQEFFDVVAEWGQGPTITDHLFNDMPHNFKHAWRTTQERAQRAQELAELTLESWTLENLEEKLGPVPAVMIQNAHRGIVKICQNFDGEHVDLAIVKKSVELIGAENMMLMTDSIDSKRLAGRSLHTVENSTLLYQDEGIVAAGSQGIHQQIHNMLGMGLSIYEIEMITHQVPVQLLAQRYDAIEKQYDAQAHHL